ncbi:DUF6531 domain-containing protein [Corynebacterium cystitidis]|uniref:RHS repeat-associated core domain-containing protein n=1 Tax=Corynebacterium cystitidis DSM 20524 TaxID=1121357 RepID=A0A1H9QGQ1_9CORY|nr:DUF6531 domain-containing protein [Corynebacterium cystitidis]WJY81817.1 Putative deoxyribonuclease RhsC [Corynebacterium cystitidis DSM 20524]SER59019.1 RHS repeat-associated core domain-containing protein [Corynebacterium cystitidis DSM 20524]SNV83319.1 Cell wall-associated polypeptide CWBP200 [Corynebacterium cystitidis]
MKNAVKGESAAKAAKVDPKPGSPAVKNQDLGDEAYNSVTKGDRACTGGEPIDMASGAMVNFAHDIRIDGVLPLVVDRNAHTSHQLGRALGPRWVSTMDIHIEVLSDEVLMVTGDGAILTFPPAPVDGSEVRGDGRGWLLSYGDGTYRVRSIAQGVTYHFRVYDTTGEVTTPPGAVVDTPPSVGQSMIGSGITPCSVAETFEVGVEIGISALVHHTGHRIDYTYDNATGVMTSMVRSDGTRLDITWDHVVERVASIWVSNPDTHPEDAPLRLVSYEYDPRGNLIRVINSHAGVLRYHYDDHDRPCGWTDRNGASYFYRFDDQGRVSSQVGTGGMFPNILYWAEDTGEDAPAGGRVCVLIETAGVFPDDPLTIGDGVVDKYLNRLETLPLYTALCDGGLDAAGLTGRGRTGARDNKPWTVDPAWLYDEVLGDIRPTVYRSTISGDVWRIITPEGGIEDREYNEYHQITAVTDSAGAVTRTTYNADGVAVSVTYPDGTTTHVEPGSWGVPVRVIGRDGHATEYEVDAFGLTTAVTHPTGARTRMDYEIRSSGAVLATTVDPDGLTTTIECDNAGRQVAVTDPAGRRTSMVRDVRGLVTESMDSDGNTTRIDYTPEGWPTRITHPDGACVTATYDGEGNQLTLTNEVGATTRTEYTVFDKPIASTDATGAVTRLVYNTQMQPVALTNADGNTWSYEYDLDGQVTRETDYNGIVTDTTVTADGLISQVTTPAGTTTLTRTVLGLTDTSVDGSGTTQYSYDELGRVTTIVNPATTISYTRDEYGRITEETVTLASGESTTHSVEFTPTGLVAAGHLTLPGADMFTTTYKRNGVGEITTSTITRTRGGVELPTPVADLTYGRGSRGERNRMTMGSLVRRFTHDTRGRMVSDHTGVLDTTPHGGSTSGGGVASSGGGVTGGLRGVAGREFTWRADTTLTGITDRLRGATMFDVDALGRVTGVSRDATRTGASTGFYTDAHADRSEGVSRQATVSSRSGISSHHPDFGEQPVSESYGFSPAGVLTRIATPAFAQEGSSAQATTPHPRPKHQTGAGAGRNSGAGRSAGGGDVEVEFTGTMPTRVGRTTYAYDQAGRVIQTVTKRVSLKPLVHRFYYATGAQPIGFSSSDEPGVGYRYLYDGLGRRVAKERVDTTTGEVLARSVFAHVGDHLVAEQATLGENRGAGYVWAHDPATGETIGQITLTGTHASTKGGYGDNHQSPPLPGGSAADWDQDQVDAVFYAMTCDLAGAPQELIHPDTGDIVGSSTQTLYGRRTWRGEQSSPLLFAGQYHDHESGWAYNRFRYYHPHAGVYNAQDPLGLSPRIASAQGYVDHAAFWVDVFGLESCKDSFAPSYESKPLETTPETQMEAYRSNGGHHVPLKSAYSTPGDGLSAKYGAPAVSEDTLAAAYNHGKHPDQHLTGGQVHREISAQQNKIFNSATDRTLTWDNVKQHDVQAHINAGIPEATASAWADEGITYLRAQGIEKPTRWPWATKNT